MRFWDSSALVSLLVTDPHTAKLTALYREDPLVVAWWGTPVECVSALARMEREGKLDTYALNDTARRLAEMQSVWQEIQPVAMLRELAMRLLRVHALHAADSLQLAAAIIASKNRPSVLGFVCLDARLVAAARREGFNVLGG